MSTTMNDEFENRESSEVVVRFATAADAPALAKLRYSFRSSFGPVPEDEKEFVRRCGLWMYERLRQGSAWQCWVADQDHTILGNLWMQLIEKVPNPTDEPEYHGYLSNFYVHENARGKGVGSMLMSAALAWAQARNVHAIILWPTERSRSLYLRYGFDVRTDLLELVVTEVENKH